MAMIFQDPMTLAEPGADDRRPGLGGGHGSQPEDERQGGARAGGRAARAGRRAAPRAPRPPVPARAVRGDAAARDDRDGDREPPERARRRRAHDRARRHDPGADRRGAQGREGGDARGDRPDHARPRADRGARGPRRRDVRGAGRRDRRRVLDLRHAATSVHRRPAREPGADRSRDEGARADSRATAERRHASSRLRVPPALRALAGPGDLQGGGAGARGRPGRARPSVGVPFRRRARDRIERPARRSRERRARDTRRRDGDDGPRGDPPARRDREALPDHSRASSGTRSARFAR